MCKHVVATRKFCYRNSIVYWNIRHTSITPTHGSFSIRCQRLSGAAGLSWARSGQATAADRVTVNTVVTSLGSAGQVRAVASNGGINGGASFGGNSLGALGGLVQDLANLLPWYTSWSDNRSIENQVSTYTHTSENTLPHTSIMRDAVYKGSHN